MSAPHPDAPGADTTAAPRKKGLGKTFSMVLIISVGLHVAGGIGAAIYIVAKYFTPPPNQFVAQKKIIKIEAKEREQKMSLAEFEEAASAPTFDNRITSTRAANIALPDLPKLPMDQLLPLTASTAVTDSISSMAGTGVGGMGFGGGGGGGTGSGVGFFGIKDQGQRIAILIDTSDSMMTRAPGAYSKVKTEAAKLVQGLGINTQFNLLIFEGGSLAFREQLVPATDGNKTAAATWITGISEDPKTSITGQSRSLGGDKYHPDGKGGTRMDLALEQVFGMQPEIIYLISDGNATRAEGGGSGLSNIPANEIHQLVAGLQKKLVQEARLHVIYYLTGQEKSEEKEMLQTLAKRNSGKFIVVDAKK